MGLQEYKVCILAAGVGNRISGRGLVNPAIFPINKKAAISYIIEKFPKEIEFIVTVGYKRDTIVEYLQLAHPDRRFTFVDIEPYEGPGTGPGASLLACKPDLQCPFVLFTADTIVIEEVPPPNKNWLGIAHVDRTEPFSTVKVEEGLIRDMIDKQHTQYHHAYIGAAGVYSFTEFWESLEHHSGPHAGEIQVTDGFRPFVTTGRLHAQFFTWFDTGTKENFQKAIEHFSREGDAFDFGKMDEFIYFIEDRVIKYYEKQDVVEKKVHRATTTLLGITPEILGRTRNFFAYRCVDGSTLYPVMNDVVCAELVDWATKHLWKRRELDLKSQEEFHAACMSFYRDKTLNRLQLFYDRTGIVDNHMSINDEPVPPVSELFERLDWKQLYAGAPGVFHGDCNFGNLIMTNSERGSKSRFVVIDWRQDLGGLVEYGDIYYDLAKLYGGMVISFELIKQNRFWYRNDGGRVYFDFDVSNSVVSASKVFLSLVRRAGYDDRKIKILAAITFLNMAPLHHDPYNRMLYYFGRLMLHKTLEGRS